MDRNQSRQQQQAQELLKDWRKEEGRRVASSSRSTRRRESGSGSDPFPPPDLITSSSGISYHRDNIETWLKGSNFTCPATNQTLLSFDLVPNHSVRRMIQDLCVQSGRFRVEKIFTPRVPVSSSQISVVLRLEDSTARSNVSETLDSLRKINSWGNESERNRLCIVSVRASAVLATAFDGFAVRVLEQLLASISWMLPIIDAEALGRLGSPESVKALV